MSERIQKVLASAGVASRRAIEQMIAEGRISVNGRPAQIGQKISSEDRVRVDGAPVKLSRKPHATQVLLYRKRVGEMVTRDDPEGRRTVFRKLPELEGARWINVGRLDINTSGLLLLTTDGELARRLMHPSFEITREYAVRVLGAVDDQVIERLRRGVQLDDGPAKFESLTPLSGDPDDEPEEGGSANRWFSVIVREGRNRLVRRIFESQNLQVSRLIRIAYGPVKLGRGIRTGGYREATAAELQALMRAVKLEVADAKHPAETKRPAEAKRHKEGKRGAQGKRHPEGKRGAQAKRHAEDKRHPEGRRPAGRRPADFKRFAEGRRPRPDRR